MVNICHASITEAVKYRVGQIIHCIIDEDALENGANAISCYCVYHENVSKSLSSCVFHWKFVKNYRSKLSMCFIFSMRD